MGALSDYMLKRWGVRTRSTEYQITVAATPARTMILPNNPDRLMALIVNYDTVLMRVAPSVAVSLTRGIPLDPAGGFTVLTADEDGELVGYEWYVFSTLGKANGLYILETEAA